MLVINAGLLLKGAFETFEPKQVADLMDVNMYQPMGMLRKFLPVLRAREDKRSGIIITSSVAGCFPGPYM